MPRRSVLTEGAYLGAVRVDPGPATGHVFRTWGSGVWTEAGPSARAARV
ncbi:hypothetical protein GCM10027168_45900 [Streptomyces capparidis]